MNDSTELKKKNLSKIYVLLFYTEVRCPAVMNELGTCFPETNGNQTALVGCPAYIESVAYDTSGKTCSVSTKQ